MTSAAISALPKRLFRLRQLPGLSLDVAEDIWASSRRSLSTSTETSRGLRCKSRQKRRTADVRSCLRRGRISVRLPMSSITSAQVRDTDSVDIHSLFVTFVAYNGLLVITL